jgi:hypothetical protein
MLNRFFERFENKDKLTISRLVSEIQDSIDDLYLKEPNNPTFEQEGFINGSNIVKEYIDQGEYGVAIEHLIYMVYESDISYPTEILEKLQSLL